MQSNYKQRNRNPQQQRDEPAISGNGGKAIGTESLTGRKHKEFEILKRLGNQLQALVGDNHPLEPDLFKPGIGPRHGGDPGVNIATPALRDQIEVGEVRLPFERDGSNIWEPSDQNPRAHGVAVPNENPPPAPPLDLIPRLAHHRDRVAVPVRL